MTPTLFIPGLVCTAEIFTPQIAALWPRGPAIVASTLTGETMAEIAASILDTAPARFNLAGFSMGGYISLEIMRLAPERVERLALMNTSAREDSEEQTNNRRASIERVEKGDYADVLTDMAPLLLHPDHRKDQALKDITVRMGLAIGPEGFIRQQKAIIGRIDSRPSLRDIRVPTLVLAGDHDGLTPADRSLEMSKAIPGACLDVIPGCGHASTVERPDRVNRSLLEWLDLDYSVSSFGKVGAHPHPNVPANAGIQIVWCRRMVA